MRGVTGVRYPSSIGASSVTPLVGRHRELERLGAALDGARDGMAVALVIEGDPGIGKSTVLDSVLAAPVDGLRVVRTAGVSTEAEMAYAAVDRLLRDMPDELGRLPSPLRRALSVATGREPGDPPDRFQVGLALLSLLGATGGPVVVAIDDAHLLDHASLVVFAFVARRLNAEPVALVIATRPDTSVREALTGIEVLPISGLDTLSSVQLLVGSGASGIDPQLAVKVVEQLEGHPLAIADLARHADADRLMRRVLTEEPLPPGELLQDLYRRQIEALSPDAGAFALLAATDTTGDPDVVRRAGAGLGLGDSATEDLERTGLVEFGDRVRFRHQLVRAAVYGSATSADRRRAHRALAPAAEARGFRTAAAIHAAAVAVAPDPLVADRLEELADATGARGALLARAGLLSRAGDLSPPGALADERALAAAEAALAAGAAGLARDLLAPLDEGRLPAASLGRFLTAQASLPVFVGDPEGIPDGAVTFARAADAFRASARDRPREQRALLSAFTAVLTTEELTRGVTIAGLADRILDGADGTGPLDTVLRGLHAQLVAPYDQAAPRIREALETIRRGEPGLPPEARACAFPLATALWDPDAAIEVGRRMIDEATARGAVQALDTVLWTLSTLQVALLDVAAAGRSLENVRELRRAIGYPAEHVVNAAHLALSGAPMEVVETAASSILALGFGGAHTFVQIGIGARQLGDGDYEAARVRLDPIVRSPFPHIARLAVPDYAEAAARSGHPDAARAAVETLIELSAVTPTPWLAGLAWRSSALVAGDRTAEEEHLRAIALLTEAGFAGDLARARLVYGEWLRRRRRRRDAREQLAAAARAFDELGAVPFAARARREYSATGDAVPPPASVAELTPQESLVAGLAAEGRSNQEIAAALFISPNTVDYHLRKVFQKLGVTSRRQLAERRPV